MVVIHLKYTKKGVYCLITASYMTVKNSIEKKFNLHLLYLGKPTCYEEDIILIIF